MSDGNTMLENNFFKYNIIFQNIILSSDLDLEVSWYAFEVLWSYAIFGPDTVIALIAQYIENGYLITMNKRKYFIFFNGA